MSGHQPADAILRRWYEPRKDEAASGPRVTVRWTGCRVSSARATIRATGSATGGNLALDAPVAAGYAGSPPVAQRGHLVGMPTTDNHSMDQAARGGFAIPTDRAKSMLRQAQSTAAAQIRPSTPPVR